MKSLAPSNTFNFKSGRDRRAQLSTPNARRHLFVILGGLLIALSTHDLLGQVGNDNPDGASGIFNGQAGGCGYDPYTGNATRSITDISVAGAVGAYPLALVRTANSRAPSTTEVFSWSGGWNHNYNWILEDSPLGSIQPKLYTVDLPDGRVEKFRAVTWDTYYRVRPGPDTPAQTTSSGVRERFVPLSNGYCYLILPDGGKVEFAAAQHQSGSQYWYKYHVTAIYDPYGLKTTIDSEVVGPRSLRRITKVTEPAGRYLQFTYLSANGPKILKVTASDGRTVQYYYACCNNWALDHVVYCGNASWTAKYQYCNSNVGQNLPPLLWTADDPMYAGPMKRIAYDYKPAAPNNPDGTTPVYGQILRERYWDGVSGHETSGAIVSTLTVGLPNNNPVYRTETRGDGATRTFIYNGAGPGYLAWASDFMNHESSQTYDSKKYINSITNFSRIETDYTCDPITGNVTQIKFPLTPGDTPGQGNTHPTVNYTYTNSYYLHTVQDEGTHTTTLTRDGNNRVTRIDYPDTGYETFAYDAAHFYQVSSHRMTTGGTETFAYYANGLRQYYSDPYHSNPGNPSIQYFYEGHGWVNGIYDALAHPTNWTYNDRGQVLVTTLTADPVDGQRHTITNAYNSDGTLQSKTDQLGHVTSYTYDDYRRITSVTPTVRGYGDNSPHTTSFAYYDPYANRDNYADTDAQASFVGLPSGKITWTVYDDDRRKWWTVVGWNSGDDATTTYQYDAVGNVTKITAPNQQSGQQYAGKSTQIAYDERNRPSSTTDALNNTTTFTYDTAGRKKTITRPNNQTISYDTFDNMNRVTQQTTSGPSAITQYSYYPSGLLYTMKDPHLYGTSYKYTYFYDLMGRKTSLQYPPDSLNQQRTEQWSYDTVGRLQTFTNRDNPAKVQAFSYDALNRMTGFTWNDNGTTPGVSFGYDAASRPITINNANANITRQYYNDNLLYKETEQILLTGGLSKTVTYTYDADGNRGSTGYPDGSTFSYLYTGRNQLNNIMSGNTAMATYGYNVNGDMTSRSVSLRGGSSYEYDALDRVTHVGQSFYFDGTRTIDYAYDNVGNRKWIQRDADKGDSFLYDSNDQVTAVRLDVTNPATPPVRDTIFYDTNGNRTSFALSVNGPTDTYSTNYLNQYTQRNAVNADYDKKGNLISGLDGSSSYEYDAQNRLTHATEGSATMDLKYDGLNRQVSRSVNGASPTYNVWDGWNLLMEYQTNGTTIASYLNGPDGVVKNLTSGNYYYHDGSGSTSHLGDSSGTHLLEWYRYDLQGAPIFYDANNNQRTASAYNVRHLFTGQQWYSEVGLYDLRNRFYSPDIGRFLQPDPIGHRGGSNLYRYCRNNPVTRSDPFGLEEHNEEEMGDSEETDQNTFIDLPDGTQELVNPSGEVETAAGGEGGVIIGGQVGGNGTEAVPYGAETGPGTVGNDVSGSPEGIGDTASSDLGGLGGTVEIGAGPGGAAGSAGGLGGLGPSPGGGSHESGGPAFDIGWLRNQLLHYKANHRADIAGNIKFANALDIGATIYVGGTLAPAGIWAGGMIVVDAGALGESAFHSVVSHPATISAVTYGVVTFNNSVHPEEQLWLPEIIEFEIKLEQLEPWILGH